MENERLTNREWQASRDKRKLFDLTINGIVYKCCTFRDDVFIYRNDERQETNEFSYNILEDTDGTEAEDLFKAYKWSDFEEYTRVRIFPLYFISRELTGVNKDFTLRLEAMFYIFLIFFPREVDIRERVEAIENVKKNGNEVYDDISRLFNYALDGDKPLELSAEELRYILKEACNMDISISDIEAYCQEINIKLKGDTTGNAKALHPFLEESLA